MIESATLDDFSCKFLSSLGADLWRPVLYDVQRSKLSWYIMVPQQPQCSLPRILASYGVKPLHGERWAIRPAGEKIESTAVWRLGAWCHYQPFISRFGILLDAKRCRFRRWDQVERIVAIEKRLLWIDRGGSVCSWDQLSFWVVKCSCRCCRSIGEVFAKCVWMCLVLLFAVKCLPRSSKWLALHLKLVIPQPRPWGQRHSRLWMDYLCGFFGESNSTAHGLCYLPVHLVLV